MREYITAIIIDDEAQARLVLNKLLERSTEVKLKVVAEFSNLPDAVEGIEKLKPDVVFVDVQMPRYAGYEIRSFFEVIDFEIIFVTAYSNYALRAFDINATDYLVKPIDRSRLKESLQRLEKKVRAKHTKADYEAMIKTFQKDQKLIVPEQGNRRAVNIEDIVMLRADGAYCKICMLDKSEIVVGKNLKYFEGKLAEAPFFYRSHRAYLVNLNRVLSMNKKDLTIRLEGDFTAKLARNRVKDFEAVIYN